MTPADCPACQIAADKHTGLIFADCPECQIRDAALGPAHHRSRKLKRITDAYRQQLASIGGDKWQEVHNEVKARWDEWKKQEQGQSRGIRDRALGGRAHRLPGKETGAPA